MKHLKNILTLALIFTGLTAFSQTDKATTQRIIEAQNYVFVATTAFPLNSVDVNAVLNKMAGSMGGGGSIPLTGSNYDVKVTKDSLAAYLPYYGRAYTARIGGINDGGIKINAKEFKYKTQKRKKGGWIITMNPKNLTNDYNSNYNLTLTVTPNGYGTLSVTSNNQQSISFNGYLAEPEPAKKAI